MPLNAPKIYTFMSHFIHIAYSNFFFNISVFIFFCIYLPLY